MKAKFDGRIAAIAVIPFIIACLFELLVFNISSIKTLGNDPIEIATDVMTDEDGRCSVNFESADTYVNSVLIEDVAVVNAGYLDMHVSLTDEGDKYEYAMATERVVPGVRNSGYINIYPYGKVHDICVHIEVSEGASAYVGRITINARRPFGINPIRMAVIWLVAAILLCAFKYGYKINCKRGDIRQLVCIVLCFVIFAAAGRWLSVSDELILSCPWPHHKQYQQLAVSISNGSICLDDLAVDERIINSDNPYDTITLMVEEIPYNMDCAYYNGRYYVYFGIIPELLLYYPHYMITGEQMTNFKADMYLYILLAAGIMLLIRELIFRYASDADRRSSRIPFAVYLLMCLSTCFFSNIVYLISKPDIYNIPIMAGMAFTFLGVGLWLASDEVSGSYVVNCILTAAGSLCMALVAGCRPQLLIFSVAAIFIFMIREDASGRLSLKERGLFAKGKVVQTVCFIVPFVLVAIVVCGYNYQRFGNILDFGATYSLTTNDMNHRGFNLDRLLRGLFCFLLQPPVMKTDFPFMESALLSSDYMGKNLCEYAYGGAFVTNLTLLSVFVPLFKKVKGFTKNAVCMVWTFCAGALVIACFDVNGAGVLYRYTCDMIPGFVIASLIMWIILLGDEEKKADRLKIYTILLLWGLFYSFLVFVGPEGGINLKNDSVVLYETIRQAFKW